MPLLTLLLLASSFLPGGIPPAFSTELGDATCPSLLVQKIQRSSRLRSWVLAITGYDHGAASLPGKKYSDVLEEWRRLNSEGIAAASSPGSTNERYKQRWMVQIRPPAPPEDPMALERVYSKLITALHSVSPGEIEGSYPTVVTEQLQWKTMPRLFPAQGFFPTPFRELVFETLKTVFVSEIPELAELVKALPGTEEYKFSFTFWMRRILLESPNQVLEGLDIQTTVVVPLQAGTVQVDAEVPVRYSYQLKNGKWTFSNLVWMPGSPIKLRFFGVREKSTVDDSSVWAFLDNLENEGFQLR